MNEVDKLNKNSIEFSEQQFKSIRKWIIVEIILLFAQFQMGMVTNLFISPLISPTDPTAILFETTGFELFLHILNGFFIVVIAFMILVIFIRIQQKLIRNLSILAMIIVTLAIIAGIMFFFYNQNDSFSMIMAMSFISVFTIYFMEVYLIKKIGSKV